MARATGLEPATSGVTGQHSNQLSYAPTEAGEVTDPPLPWSTAQAQKPPQNRPFQPFRSRPSQGEPRSAERPNRRRRCESRQTRDRT